MLSHDVSTTVGYAYDRVEAGQQMPGLFEVGRRVSLGDAIEDLLLLARCSPVIQPRLTNSTMA